MSDNRSVDVRLRARDPGLPAHLLSFVDDDLVSWTLGTDPDHIDADLVLEVLTPFDANSIDPSFWAALPLLEDELLYGQSSFRVVARDGSSFGGPVPLCLFDSDSVRPTRPSFAFNLSLLWILRDGPFGNFGWHLAIEDSVVVANESVTPRQTDDLRCDGAIELDFPDAIGLLVGELEVRDAMALGNARATIGALSALTWLVEGDPHLERAGAQFAVADACRHWATATRSDRYLEWASRERAARGIASPRLPRVVS